jgi:CheY-like chemotaxis protein
MPAPSTSAASAALAHNFDWQDSALGEPAAWPHTLRVALEIMFGTPAPMLLLWGPRRLAVYNAAYAAFTGAVPPGAPGGTAPGLPAALAGAEAGFALAAAGQPSVLTGQRVAVLRCGSSETLDCDLHLTPLRDEHGAVAGVLCALARSAEAPPAAAPQPLRVLVVEDNLDSQYLVCEMLKAFGHEADGVAHAEGAFEQLARSSYDVLFSDVSLPGMSGVELARQALLAHPQLQVIFASGYGEALLRHLEFPFQSLQKPYEIEQLQAALAKTRAPSV